MALNDPVPYVRDMALHALGCQRCKPEPLAVDTLDIIILRARTEERWKKTYEYLVDAGLLKADTDWKKAFTTEFVKDLNIMM